MINPIFEIFKVISILNRNRPILVKILSYKDIEKIELKNNWVKLDMSLQIFTILEDENIIF